MRSVVVVLPASMCALMPMFRYLSMGVLRGINVFVPNEFPGGDVRRPRPRSESVVSERLVRLRHAVHFLAFLDRAAAAFRRLHQLVREPLPHRLLAALLRGLAQPAHREG